MRAADKLRATYSAKENDVMLHFPLGVGTSSDGHWLASVFDKSFTEQLAARGYDVATMKFSVEPEKGNSKFASQREADDE